MRSLTRSFSKSPKVSKEVASISVQHIRDVLKDGFLWKRSAYNIWKKQFFVLTSVGIYSFASQNATTCKGLIRFSTYTSVTAAAANETRKANAFQILYFSSLDSRHQSTVFLMAESEAEMNSWMSAIYSTLENAEKVTRQSYRFTPIILDESKPRKYRSLVITVAEAKELSIKIEPELDKSPDLSNLTSSTSSISSNSSIEGKSEFQNSNKAIVNSYTMIDIGRDQYRTRTSRNKSSPFWGEDFTIDLEEDIDFAGVDFTVWCEDKNRRPYISGRICMDEEQLINSQLVNQWCYLDPASTNDFASGYITLRWTCSETGFIIRVLEGRNLAMKSAHGAIYVEASFLTHLFQKTEKTQSIRSTRNPFWNEELDLYAIPRSLAKEFKITCYDDSLPAHAGFLGEFCIPYDRLTQSTSKDEVFILKNRKPSGASYARRSYFGSTDTVKEKGESGEKKPLHSSGGVRLHSRSSSSPNLRQIAAAAAAAAAAMNGDPSVPNSPPLPPPSPSSSLPSSPSISPSSPLIPPGSPGNFLNFFNLSGSPFSSNNSGGASPLSGSASIEQDSVSNGSIRLSVRYLVEDILPTASYKPLHKTLTSHDGIQMSIALGSLVSGAIERTQYSTSLVRAYDALGESTTLIIALTTHEILSTEDPHVMFRGNFLGSKALDAYMKLIGSHYLTTTLSGFVTKLYEFGKSCEVDPKAKPGTDLNRNIKRLQSITLDVLKVIYTSIDHCPSPLRTVFANLQRNVTYKFGDLKVRYSVVAGLLFSRLFCVALLSPKRFGLALDHPDTKTERTLKLVVKVIQSIANLVMFEEKEDYMKCMNPFIQENIPFMRNFLDSISKPTTYYTPSYNTTVINLERESACIHSFMRKYKDELAQKYSHAVWVKPMTNILEELEKIRAKKT